MPRILALSAGLAMLLTGAGTVKGGPLDVFVIQCRNDRLYLPAGENDGVFAGHQFTIYCGCDSLFTGVVEQSHRWVSVSGRTDGFFDDVDLSECRAIIATAEIDCSRPIRIGYQYQLDGIIRQSQPDAYDTSLDTTLDSVITGCETELVPYKSALAMTLDFERGNVDAIVAYDWPEAPDNELIFPSPAPQFAVLLPNLSRPVNEHALLTTSLYYRFEMTSFTATSTFGFEQVRPFHSFQQTDVDAPRAYGYDPARGKALIDRVRKRSKDLTIAVTDSSLNTIARYFADILSRDGMNVSFKSSDADLVLTYISIDPRNPLTPLQEIVSLLRQNAPTASHLTEALEMVEHNLESAAGATDPESQTYFCTLAEKRLKEDLGVFPLFRPLFHLAARRNLRGYNFDDDGRLNVSSIQRLKLPSAPKGGAP